MKMGSSMWKLKHKVKRNPKWLLTPLVVMMGLLLIRMLFAWKAVGYLFLLALLAAVVAVAYLQMQKGGRRRTVRRKKWKK